LVWYPTGVEKLVEAANIMARINALGSNPRVVAVATATGTMTTTVALLEMSYVRSIAIR
jgi:hypothetical protein